MQNAKFIFEPELVIPHGSDRDFIGPGLVRLHDGRLMMVVTSGRSPADFGKAGIIKKRPRIFTSEDGGRSWNGQGSLNLDWNLSGAMFGGGISLLYLQDGRLVMVGHRHRDSLYGGGTPVFSTSGDDGRTWKPARMLVDCDDTYYVMNNRLRQLESGRLIVPVAMRSLADNGDYIEGGVCDSRCFYSDDCGESWQLSPYEGRAFLEGDLRGMAEPAIEIIEGDKLIMLARTGAGCLCCSCSHDGGLSWSTSQKTRLISPCSSLALVKGNDGSLIVFYNHCQPLELAAFFPRNPLTYSVSYDQGVTWSQPVCIDKSGCEPDGSYRQHIYPASCLTDDGILVVYSTHWACGDNQFKKNGQSGIEDGGIKAALITKPELSTFYVSQTTIRSI